MVIGGQRDAANEVENDIDNRRWQDAGVYDEETGLFYLREGESIPIENHFTVLKLNRLQSKRSVNQYVSKKAQEQPTHKPKVSNKT